MRTNQNKPINRLNRWIPIGFLPACLIALSLLVIASPSPSFVFAGSDDSESTVLVSNAGQTRTVDMMDIMLVHSDDGGGEVSGWSHANYLYWRNQGGNEDPHYPSPRVEARGFTTPRIASNGVRMYEVSEFEAGGWPVRVGGDDTYGSGELIAVEVEFSEDIRLNGEATFRIQIGSSRRDLVPASVRGDTIIFATLVRPSDEDADGIWIGDNTSTLDHNPADYFQTAVGNQNVSLTHASLGTQTNHKVDGSSERPKINRVRITSSPQHADYYVRGETVKLEVTFDRSVAVSGNPQARLRIEALGATATRTANYISGSGTSKLIYEYQVFLLDNDSNGIAIPANVLAKDGDISAGSQGGGSIKGASRTLRANLASGGQRNNASHKVDARYVAASEIMANAQWGWKTNTGTSDSITMAFTVREDPGHFSEDHALVMAFGWSSIGSTRFGFGIRTDLDKPGTDGSQGKGIVFNRWDTHDKTLANSTEDGWVVTGMILGDFISIRKPYDWGVGDYTVRIAHDETADDPDGRWYGMWITDSEDEETYMGSLKFPMVGGEPPKINPRGDLYQSMLALLGGSVIKPQEIPVFEIALSPPDEGSSIDPPKRVTTIYSQFHGVMTNSNITHDREDNRVIMRAGGTTLRTTNPGTVITIRNDEATGKPIITGTNQVGQTLGVNTDGISDADGPDDPITRTSGSAMTGHRTPRSEMPLVNTTT